MTGSSVNDAKNGFIISSTTKVTTAPQAAERIIPFDTTLSAIS